MSALITAREVAELIGVSTETILRWTRRGDLPAVRLPSGAIRYRADALNARLDDRATPGPGSATDPAGAAPGASYPVGVGSESLPTRLRIRAATDDQED